MSKAFHGKSPRTTVAISQSGRAAQEQHWRQLDALRSMSAPAAKTPGAAPALTTRPRPRLPEVGTTFA